MSERIEDPFALTGSVLERRFHVDRVVARGGFGVVYQARHIALRKTVALKVLFIPPGMQPPERQRFLEGFEREAQTVAALDHPAIVRAYDFGVARPPGRRELPWLALEWIDGVTLEDELRERTAPLGRTEALLVMRPVLQALAFAHSRGVVHRDLKPANIMLSRPPEGAASGMVTTRLLDFGIAQVLPREGDGADGARRGGSVVSGFTLPYAAPEQTRGEPTGPWTDVHAVGLVFTRLFTLREPYPGDAPEDVEAAVCAPTRPTPARFGVDVGPWEPVLARATALDPAARYPDAQALYAAIKALTGASR